MLRPPLCSYAGTTVRPESQLRSKKSAARRFFHALSYTVRAGADRQCGVRMLVSKGLNLVVDMIEDVTS